MAKCKIEEPESPWVRRTRAIGRAMWVLIVVTYMAIVALVVYGVTLHMTRVKVTTTPITLSFDWKCRLCGANNHITEEIGR